MTFALALALAQTALGELSWQTLEAGQLGTWYATASAPVMSGSAPLSVFVSKDAANWCQARMSEFGASVPKRDKPGKPDTLALHGVMSVYDDKAVSMVYDATETRGGQVTKRLLPLTYGMTSSGPKRLVLKDILSKDVTPNLVFDHVIGDKLDPQIRDQVRKEAWADSFVITPSALSWIIHGKVVKVPIEDLERFVDKRGPLASFWPQPIRPVTVRGQAVWTVRESIPLNAMLEVSLLLNRDDTPDVALGVSNFVVTYPPTSFDAIFQLNEAADDDRFYLDVRVVADGKTLYRNRNPVRVPVDGWQTRHIIQLEPER